MKNLISLFMVVVFMAWSFSVAEGMGPVTTYVMPEESEEIPEEGEEESGMNLITTSTVADEPNEVPEEVEEAGITPDSPLWGLERAIERISLALTLGKSAKAKKGLAHAHERLMEVQVMIAAKKLDAAAEAQEDYDDIVAEVEDNVAGLGDGEAELADEIEIEEELAEQRTIVQEINSMKLKMKGLTSEQQAQLGAIVSAMEGSTARAQFSVRAKKNKTKMKIKATEGLSDEELEALEAQIKGAAGGDKVKIVGRTAKSEAKGKLITQPGNDSEEKGKGPKITSAAVVKGKSKGKKK